jgi:GTP-binding protein YchF
VKLGIIGLPAAGKTTIFNALAGTSFPVGYDLGAGAKEIHSAAVDVPDKRLTALSKSFKPKKTTACKIEYADIGGLGALDSGQALPGDLLNALEQVDGFVLVLRSFDDPNIPHPLSSINPQRDLELVEEEFLLNDMLRVERRLARLAEERGKGGRDRVEVDREIKLMKELQGNLEEGVPLRELDLSPERERLLSGYNMLTQKPILGICSIDEECAAPELDLRFPFLTMRGKLEMEISQLPQDDRKEYYQEYGIETPGMVRLINASYEVLDSITFFTVSESEIRAWNLPHGGTAHQAAGIIHSDMERGFIRAEVIPWDELLEYGSLAEARAAGILRVEGKEYEVRDGEVIYIRFNV